MVLAFSPARVFLREHANKDDSPYVECVVEQAGRQGLVIVGAGPGGLAPLFAAASHGVLQEVLDLGVTVLERGRTVGDGALGKYAIRSDSSAEAILDSVRRSREPRLLALLDHPVAQAIDTFRKGPVPLALVGQFLRAAGSVLCHLVSASRRGCVLTDADVRSVQQTEQGFWQTCFVHAGQEHRVISSSVLLATGACQPTKRLAREKVAGLPLLPKYGPKVMQSGFLLTPPGIEEVSRRLAQSSRPRVAVIGGSTSAVTVVFTLLTKLRHVPFEEASIALLHRSPLRLFYETTDEALADGYADFTQQDVCTLTGRVFRLSGFRFDARELLMQCLGIAGRPPEPRVKLIDLTKTAEGATQQLLEESSLIVAAMGYRPRLLPVLDVNGERVDLLTPSLEFWSSVDSRSRVLRFDGQPLEGLFALGLAIGPGASRELGGELGYRGQVNSLWLWQHTLGAAIILQVVERAKYAGERRSRIESFVPGRVSVAQHDTGTFTDRPALAGAASL